jgi:transcriptional regulator with XRE-family HTH domain
MAFSRERLIKARSGLGWSQQDLAEASGVAAAQISRYEAGRSAPRPEVVARLAKALNVQFEWLASATPQIERGEPDRHLPSGHVLEVVDIPAAVLQTVQREADRLGITLEMMVKEIIMEGVVSRVSERRKLDPAFLKPLLSDSRLKELEERIAALEAERARVDASGFEILEDGTGEVTIKPGKPVHQQAREQVPQPGAADGVDLRKPPAKKKAR